MRSWNVDWKAGHDIKNQNAVPSDQFQEDLYPDTAAPVPALTAGDWQNGINRPPVYMSMKTGKTRTCDNRVMDMFGYASVGDTELTSSNYGWVHVVSHAHTSAGDEDQPQFLSCYSLNNNTTPLTPPQTPPLTPSIKPRFLVWHYHESEMLLNDQVSDTWRHNGTENDRAFCAPRKNTMRSMILAVPQTAENNLSGPPWEIYYSCLNYQRWHTAPLLLKVNQRASVQQFHPAHHTFYRADPPEGCRLCEDASSEDIDLFSERRSDATLEEGDCSTILFILMPGCNLHINMSGGSEVTFKPLVPRLSVREGFLALTSPGVTVCTHKPKAFKGNELSRSATADNNYRMKFAFLSTQTVPDYRPLDREGLPSEGLEGQSNELQLRGISQAHKTRDCAVVGILIVMVMFAKSLYQASSLWNMDVDQLKGLGAVNRNLQSKDLPMSFMKRLNRKGPRSGPWGTPDVACTTESERDEANFTCKVRLVK
ncbi:hypothetical protein J6590_048516 [Homalodisca vitripennis]|nr:hypothetical protein J6590_048516 [Homalodisca vitripennis]